MMCLNKPIIAIDIYKEAVCTTQCILHAYGEITPSHQMNDQVKLLLAIRQAFPPATFSFTSSKDLAIRRVSPLFISCHAYGDIMDQTMTG